MGAFGVVLSILHFVGLYVQLSAASNPGGDAEVDNHISGNALFTEVPHDIVTESGQDVEMACSFRGAGSPSVSLEIQWWYIRNHKEWTEKAAWTSNQVVPLEEMVKDATKISVVKVAGSNISHKLRLSKVKMTDEGTYECRVIDFSDSHIQHHRVRAYLQVQPPGERKAHTPRDKQQHEGDDQLHQEDQHPHPHMHPGNQQQLQGDHQPHKESHHAHAGEQKLHHGDQKLHHGDQLHQEDQRLHAGSHHKKEEESRKRPAHNHQSEGKEMKRRSVEGASDCTTDGCGH
ncbi:V-set and transmembrane domain-containing protein 2-like protein [Clupea harengus]|uniref:V-set and transmembrane domain-containing protein 2-like protein n=1 Tax=Clupea harengus TaxID=7950 RepID=A0A6P3W0F1_CLUHA|nr:V-set and transmembrane domain-containing protein 2-like protein [Clupea harengus]